MTEDRKALRATLREKFPREHGQLLPALHFIHDEFGYLPDWGMEVVGWHLGIPASEVYGAATSYTELRVEKPGDHVVRVCTGLSCAIAGAREIFERTDKLLDSLGADDGGTPSATLEETACGFLCGVAPAVELDGVWHGRATADSVAGLVEAILTE